MKRTIITALGAGALLLAGCSGGGDGTTATSSSTPTSTTVELPMSGQQEYETVKAMQSDLRTGGIVCYDLTLRPGKFAAQMGACNVEGDEIVLSTFADEVSQRQAQDALASLEEITGEYGFVSGGNWLVNCGEKAMCLKVQGVLGGRAEYPFT